MTQFLFIGLLGAVVLLLGLLKTSKARASRAWPRTMGSITATSVREDISAGSDDMPDSRSFVPVIRYQFQAGGQTLEGDRIGFDRKAYQKKQDAEAVAARYPVGAQVQVLFNPLKPGESVLQPGSGLGWVLIAAGGGTILLAALAATR